MSLQLTLTAMGDFSEVRVQQAITEARNEKINEALGETEKRAEKAFNSAISAMRAGYMMVSGVAKIMGGSMGQMFSSMIGAAVAGIATYKAIATAIAASGPWGWVQAAAMFSSLMVALSSLGQLMEGQQKLGTQLDGINMSLQGFAQLIGSFNFS